MRKITVLLIALLVLGGCAFKNRNNTPLLNLTEKHLVPKTQPAKAFSYPITIPLSFLAVMVDIVIIHPVMVTDDAARDAKDLLWTISESDWENRYLTTTASCVPRTVATPIFFVGDWLARSLFDITGKSAETGKIEEAKRLKEKTSKEEAQNALSQGDFDKAISMAKENVSRGYDKEWNAILLSALIMKKDVAGIAESKSKLDAMVDIKPEYFDSFLKLIEESAPVEQIRMLLLIQKHFWKFHTKEAAERIEQTALTLKGLLKSQDRAVVATSIATLSRLRGSSAAKKVLEEVSKGDDPVLSALAREAR
ncbi:MAG: hypothetical protein A4E66_01330 [Syntrophus sp. PtaB.Bin001]|nr:MAG: hypothetical protein A4E66_01330 [Syntrophus sp. PtaB.Bin001]